MESKRERLFELLRTKSFHYRDNPPFTLVSGKTSPCYIDCKPTTNNAEGMCLIGEIVFERIRDLDPQAIGGLTMGADPIAHAVSVISNQKGRPIHSVCIRKQAKDHGNVKKHGVEGDASPGDRIVILDDVITTGGSTIQAIDAAERFGLEVAGVVVLVDREDGGKENIERRVPGKRVDAVFRLSEFLATVG